MSQSTASTIDQLLSSLKMATGTLRETLREAQKPSAAPEPPHAMKSRQAIVSALMCEVERRYGIAPGDQVERKLVRIFEAMIFEELEHWSQSLFSPYAIEAEWLSLVECLTVHETYFDRDREQLSALFTEILPHLIEKKHRSGDYRIRIWSAGCSSGEETYNLTMLALMALRDAGFALERSDGSIVPVPTWSLYVLGSDISSQMIRIAKSGIYTTGEMGSFRSMNPQLWQFFDELKELNETASGGRSMRIKRCIASLTGFRRHNLMDMMVEATPFDLIVCRNVLIYFDNNKKKVLENLCRPLAPGGVLVLGATDVMLNQLGLERHQHNGDFWYEKV